MNTAITFTWGDIIGALSYVAQAAGLYGLFMWRMSKSAQTYESRIAALEAHGDTIRKVVPLESRFDEFQETMRAHKENVERTLRDMAQSMQYLAIAVGNSGRNGSSPMMPR